MEKFLFGIGIEWWVGIIERRDIDPIKVGRCKVRVFGHHDPDTSKMPTENLPDAYPVEPLTGTFWSTAREGDTVIGIFLDPAKQSLLIMGKLPAEIQSPVTVPGGEGYKDARDADALMASPRPLLKSLEYALSGVSRTEFDSAPNYPQYGDGFSSLPFLSSGDVSKVPNQINPEVKKSQASITRFNTAKGDTWFEKPSEYAAVYPYNHTYQSESLHILEFYDTPSSERVNQRHRLGSGFEFFPDGEVVEKVVKDKYTIVLGDNKVGIYGTCDITVHGDATFLVEGNRTEHVSGNYFLSVDGDFKTLVKGNKVLNVKGDWKNKADGTIVSKADGANWIAGSAIQWNSSSTPDVESIHDFDLPTLPDDTLSFENQQKLITATGSALAPADDPKPSDEGETVESTIVPTPLECPVVPEPTKPFTNGDVRYRIQLSRYYQLADVSVRALYPHQIGAQNGLTQDQIICNLAFLCKNSLDPLSSQFPGARLNCGFRKTVNGKSQHESGEAVDVQWPSIKVGNLSKYLDIANWIVSNVPFDQLILEHGNTIWLHISLKKTGTNRKQVLTMKDGIFTPGLHLYGRS